MKLAETEKEWVIPVVCFLGIMRETVKRHSSLYLKLLYSAVGIAWVILGPSVRQRMDNEYWGITQISSLTVMYVVLLLLAGHLTWTVVFKALAWWEKRKK